MSKPVTTVTIVGGGLIGLFTALYANRRGYQVRVIDRSHIGSGAARGNAGEICPAFSKPLAQPGMVRYAAMNSFARDAALHIRFPPSFELLRWVWSFARNCRTASYKRNWETLAPFAQSSFELYRELPDQGLTTVLSRSGNLRCFLQRDAAEREFDGAQVVRRLGQAAPARMMSGAEMREIAPILSEQVVAGFHWPGQWFVDPSRLVDDLVNILLRAGVEIQEHTTVMAIAAGRNSVQVDTDHGTVATDRVVVAPGAWAPELLKTVGVNAPIQAGKGYSFSVKPPQMPDHVINMPQSNAVATPMGGRLRIAGTMEFDGSMDRFNPHRIRRIVRAASPYLEGVDWDARTEEWVGPRPMTPDGLPLIGPARSSDRVVIAAGHNMLGLTLAPATAKLVVGMLRGEVPAWSRVFDANRFGTRPD